MAKDFEGANNIATVAYCLFMMFDGHYINNKSIPEGAKFIKQMNFYNWGIAAAARSELHGLGDLHGCRDQCGNQNVQDTFNMVQCERIRREGSPRPRDLA